MNDQIKAIRPPVQNINARRADVTTPLAPPETDDTIELPRIEIRTTIEHRGRSFTIVASGMTLDTFCDLLDKRGYAPGQQTQEWQRLPDGTPLCPRHHIPMRLRDRQGDKWYSHAVDDGNGNHVYCKGYRGKDSPGYDIE